MEGQRQKKTEGWISEGVGSGGEEDGVTRKRKGGREKLVPQLRHLVIASIS